MRWISPPLMMIKVLLYSLGFRNWNLNIFRNGQTRVGIWESKCPAGELLHDNSVTVTYEQFFHIQSGIQELESQHIPEWTDARGHLGIQVSSRRTPA